jgi:hypothetical protein
LSVFNSEFKNNKFFKNNEETIGKKRQRDRQQAARHQQQGEERRVRSALTGGGNGHCQVIQNNITTTAKLSFNSAVHRKIVRVACGSVLENSKLANLHQ